MSLPAEDFKCVNMDKEFEQFKSEYLDNIGTPSKNSQKVAKKRALKEDSIMCDCCPDPNLAQINFTPKKITLMKSKFNTIRKVSLFSLRSTIFL